MYIRARYHRYDFRCFVFFFYYYYCYFIIIMFGLVLFCFYFFFRQDYVDLPARPARACCQLDRILNRVYSIIIYSMLVLYLKNGNIIIQHCRVIYIPNVTHICCWKRTHTAFDLETCGSSLKCRLQSSW